MLSALLAAAGGTAESFWDQLSVDDLMQNYAGNALPTAREMHAGQKLQRRYFGINMNLEKEKLYREDIRDLMELTVGRMDVYLVVGTLLVTFSIEWFTNDVFLKSNTPEWFRTLFLVSNFSAVGYLVLSVWLAMHASVAAHSVGVRLLTSFARLTVPSREEIQQLRVKFVPQLKEFLALGRAVGSLGKQQLHKAHGLFGRFSASRAGPAQSEVTAHGDVPVSSGPTAAVELGATDVAGQSFSLFQSTPNSMPAATTTRVSDMKHIRRFMEEQKLWLGYDAYSRVCMCLGMNQLLQALSYFVVGKLGNRNLVSGIAAFFGIKALALLLLQLDIMGMCESWKEYAIVLSFTVVPTTLAASGFLLQKNMMHGSGSLALDLAVTPCFVLHGIWLLYIVFDLDPDAPRCGLGSSNKGLPKRIRTVNYLDVCSEQQQELAEAARQKEAERLIAPLHLACKDLVERMNAMTHERSQEVETMNAMTHERSQEVVGQVQRGDADLRKLSERLAEELERARNWEGAASKTETAQSAFFDAEQALSRYDVWEKAPDIRASLEALREKSVMEHLTDEQKQTIEQSYQEFLHRCHELELGIASGTPLSEAERRHVRVDVAGDLPTSIWVRDGAPSHRAPETGVPSTSFRTAVTTAAAWATQADVLQNQRNSLEIEPDRHMASQNAEPHQRLDVAADTDGGQQVEESRFRLIPSNAVPDEEFPSKIVRKFTVWASAWWFISALLHVVGTRLFHVEVGLAAPQVLARLGAADLDHAPFFEVTALNCNGSHVLLADHFSWWVAERQPHPTLKFIDRLDAGIATELSWIHKQHISDVNLQIPESWRMVAAAWESCAGGLDCDKVRLAGWDGTSVVLATADNNVGSAGAWQVTPEFRVHPGLVDDAVTSRLDVFLRRIFSSQSAAHFTYHEVIAMHLSPGGKTLTILFRSGSSSSLLLDVWNLSEGALLGTWSLDSHRYAGVCHDGNSFVLAKEDEDGPVVYTLELPLQVQNLSLQRGRSSDFLEA